MEICADKTIWPSLVCIWSLIALHPLTAAVCPLDFSGLDFSEAILACTEPNNGNCCQYIKVLIAIAMSQYANSTGTLGLPENRRVECVNMTLMALQTNGISFDIAAFCGVKAAIIAFQGCSHLPSMKDIVELPRFLEVQKHCAKERLSESACKTCFHSSEAFLSGLSRSQDGESIWAQCGSALFVAIASSGDSDFAMDKANCLFNLQNLGGLMQPQSWCPFKFEPWQIKDITDACDIAEEKSYICCLLAWITLQITASDTGKPLETFFLSTRQANACLNDLTSKLKGHRSSLIAFKSCHIPASSIFRESSQGCNNISTVSQFSWALQKKNMNFSFVEDSCKGMKESCDTCRKAIQKAAYIAAGPEFDFKTIQSCANLAFLVLARATSPISAAQLGSCLYAFSVSTPKAKPFSFMPSPLLPPAPQHGVAAASSSLVNPVTGSTSKVRTTVIMATGFGVTAATLILLLLFVILIKRKRMELNKSKRQAFIPHWSMDNSSSSDVIQSSTCKTGFKRYKYHDIQRATNNFSTIIGRGGFGKVYKARFKGGLLAAVKRVQKSSREGENGFSKEIELIKKLHHRHLVTLLGFCAESCDRFLVYEYMENGSLKDHLHGQKTSLSWRTRLQIAKGVAAGLEYLHYYCEPPLCHQDIKSSNILLDGNFTAKVADFGLARIAPNDCAKFPVPSTSLCGTPGYMDPEYAVTRALTEKSDVYSFGVLLFEIVSGRNAVHQGKNLVEWAQKYISMDCRTSQLVDPDLVNMFNVKELQDLLNIASLCTQKEGKARPTMLQVVKLLHEISPM